LYLQKQVGLEQIYVEHEELQFATDPWSYTTHPDGLLRGRTWDQSLLTVKVNTITRWCVAYPSGWWYYGSDVSPRVA